MFAKYWEPGAVKTRLAETLGEQPAARIYRAFVETLLRRLTEVGDRQVLAFSPSDRETAFQRGAENWELQPQLAVGDLGARMQHFFESAIRDGYRHVVLIGSDSPDLPLALLAQAFDQLHDYPVVLGPSLDGGYYLVGAADRVPPIFDDMPWSSPRLWERTTARLAEHQCRFAELPAWYDVDTVADLGVLQQKLSASTTDPWLDHLRSLVDQCLHDNT